MADDIEFNYGNLKNNIIKISRDRRFQWGATIVIFLIILFLSSSIRLSNWELLTDSTTGKKIPLALDPYHFLRIAETIVETNGNLPEFDPLRSPKLNISWHGEIMPDIIVLMYKFALNFTDVTIQEMAILSPVLFYIMGLILFFFLVYSLTNKKSVALLSSCFLAFAPAYLYRTMAGFSDHESIGMLALFSCFLAYTLSVKHLNKNILRSGLYGFIVAFLSILTILSWGGGAKFVFMVLPSSFLLIWLAGGIKKSEKKSYLFFYLSWFVSLFISGLIFKYPLIDLLNGYILASFGLLSLFTLAYILIDFILELVPNKKGLFGNEKYRIFIVIGLVIFGGILALLLIGRSPFLILQDIWIKIFHPWGQARVALTVAENAQPYLDNWINQTGKRIFWLFTLGAYLLGFLAFKNVKSLKNRIFLNISWILIISGILFSRISANSILNGTNLLSQFFYIGSLIVGLGYIFWRYYCGEIEIEPRLAIIMSWTFFVLIAGKAATRIFFALAPLVCFVAAIFVIEIYHLAMKNRDEIFKKLLLMLFVILLLISFLAIYSSEKSISISAKSTGPSAGIQWQNAMSWVRTNTSEDSLFVHWWDYGYWVQTLGERATVSDGGHSEGDFGDHLIGRYVLTTPKPETALSYMKTWDVDHLLIDPTEVGKYSAYSKIGSGKDGKDRFDILPILISDPSQMIENSNSTTHVYSGGSGIFEDIIYDTPNGTIFLPAEKSGILAILLTIENNQIIRQPEAVYIYNGKQYRIPLRKVFINGELIDFGSGYDATFLIVPAINGAGQINIMGAGIYLSNKVQDSLFAKLYLMEDARGYYDSFRIAHKSDDPFVASVRSQVGGVGDFLFYGRLLGPIKIWNVNYPEEINEIPEFLRNPGLTWDWGEFDNAEFIK